MSTPAPVLGTDAGLHFDTLPPLSLYVHLPWCVRKCPYCDFNSYEARGALPDLEYVGALLRDLRGELPLAQECGAAHGDRLSVDMRFHAAAGE